MSLPPYKHAWNPALERKNEPLYESSMAPLITHSGVLERRRTTDSRLIRSQPAIPEIEFEYLPMSCIGTSDNSSIRQSVNSVSSEKSCKEREEFFKASGDIANEKKVEKAEKGAFEGEPKKCKGSNEKDRDTQSIYTQRSIASDLSSKSNASQNENFERHETQKATENELSFSNTSNETVKNVCVKTNYNQSHRYQELGQPANGLDDHDHQFRFRKR